MSKELGVMTQKQKIMETIRDCVDRIEKHKGDRFEPELDDILGDLRDTIAWVEEDFC